MTDNAFDDTTRDIILAEIEKIDADGRDFRLFKTSAIVRAFGRDLAGLPAGFETREYNETETVILRRTGGADDQ